MGRGISDKKNRGGMKDGCTAEKRISTSDLEVQIKQLGKGDIQELKSIAVKMLKKRTSKQGR